MKCLTAIVIAILALLFKFVPGLGNIAMELLSGNVTAIQHLFEVIINLLPKELEQWITIISNGKVDVAGGEESISGTKQTSFEGKFGPKKLAHDDYTIGWVSALPTAAMAMLDERHPDLPKPSTDFNYYILGSIGKHNIAIACLPLGKYGTNPAAAVAARMVNTFPSIKVGLLVGIGGGIPSSKVRLGDIVIGTPDGPYPGVVQWDLGKAEENGFRRTGALNNPPTALLTTLSKLKSTHEAYGSKISQRLDDLKKKFPRLASKYTWSKSLRDPLSTYGEQNKPEDITVHYGLIASGNQVVKNEKFRDNLNESLRGNLLCVEMEAAGLVNDFPCIVIRGICNYADSRKSKDWQEFAAAVAAAYAKELIESLQPSEVTIEPPIREKLG